MNQKYKHILYNLITGLSTQAVSVLLAFLIPRLFLVNFGSEIKGLLSTVTQIFAYLSLLEAGVGLATVQALYGPISRDDRNTINAVMAATRYYYRRTGIIYLVVVLLFAAAFSLLTQVSLPRSTVFLAVLLQGLPSVLSYLIQGKYRLLLEAEGKSYVLNNLQMGMLFFVNIGKVVILLFSANILLVQSLSTIGSLLQIGFLLFYIRKNYRWLDMHHVTPDFEAISQKSSAMVHQISGVIFNNTDVLLISAFCGFMTSSVYTVYNSFFSQISNLISSLSGSLLFSLGQLFHYDRAEFDRKYDLYESCFITVTFIINTVMYLFILPLVKVYTRGIQDTNYLLPLLPALFVAISLLANGKLPMNQVIIFAEHFQKTRHHAVIEAAINVVLSVVGVMALGIYGGLLATVAALLYRANAVILYASREILHRSPMVTYKKWLLNLAVFAALVVLLGRVLPEMNSYAALFGWGCVFGLVIAAVYLAALCISQPCIPKTVLRTLRSWRNKT